MNQWENAQKWEYIQLSRNKFAKVSREDYPYLNQFKWYFNHGYAVRHPKMINGVRKGKIMMHTVVNNTPPGMITDHINGDTLDNRRENLRSVTSQQNAMNSKRPSHNKTGKRGVVWHRRDKVWTARIMYKGKRINLGYFSDLTLAIEARDTKERELYGEFRRQN